MSVPVVIMIKRLTINFLIIFMIFMGVIYGYTQSFSLSKFDRFSYAEADNWSSCDSSDLVTAFRYYCKSRNLAINGSVADALTSFTTTTFNNICSTLGIDPTELQAELKKTTDGNLGLRFLFSNTGITAYNRIFAEFLQNNDLAVGDSVDNEVVKSGKWLQVTENSGCYLFVIRTASHTNNNVAANGSYTKSNIVTYGSPYLKDNLYGTNSYSWRATFNNSTYTFSVSKSTNEYYPKDVNFNVYTPGGGTSLTCKVVDGGYEGKKLNFNAYISYALLQSDNSIRCITYDTMSWNGSYKSYLNLSSRLCSVSDMTNPPEDTDITIDTPGDTVINNNNYTNNYVIIYNDGDTYYTDDDDEPGPDTPPGGGGGGDDPGGEPDPTPTGPSLPDWQPPSGTGTIGSDGTFDFDLPFSLPNLNIDWSLKDIGHKFPFCIPGDIVSFYQTLAVEPRAPAIDAHIPIGTFYDWHFVADFSQYNNWAVIIRAVEYVGFVIGLIYFTVRMVKG